MVYLRKYVFVTFKNFTCPQTLHRSKGIEDECKLFYGFKSIDYKLSNAVSNVLIEQKFAEISENKVLMNFHDF